MWDRLLARLVFASARLIRSSAALAKGFVDGIWLGLLNDRTLVVMDEVYYRSHDRMYADAAYNTQGLWDWEQRAIEGWFPAGGRILVTAAGAGREAHALAGTGRVPVAFECNEHLREVGNALMAPHGIRIGAVPRDAFPALSEPVDGVVVGWGSYMLMRGPARRRVLADARSAVPDGTPILLSFFTRSSDWPYFLVAATVGSWVRRVQGLPPLERGDALAPGYAHHFTRDSLSAEMSQAGFDMVHFDATGYGHAVGIATQTRHDGTD